MKRTVAFRAVRGLGLALLLAAAPSTHASPGKKLILWGGGTDPSDAVRSLEDFNAAMREWDRRGDPTVQLAKGFPMALESSRISGLRPNFFVLALGLCSDEEAARLLKTFPKDSSEGAYTRTVSWAPEGSAGQDLCPKLQPQEGAKPPEVTQPKRDCLPMDSELCKVTDPSGAVHLERTRRDGVVRTGALPPPVHFKPAGVVGSAPFGSFSSFERSYQLDYWTDSRTLTLEEKTWLGPEETTEGGEDAIESSRQLTIEVQKERFLVRSFYAYSLSGNTTCSENVNFSTASWNAKCQQSSRTVRKKGKRGSGEDQYQTVPIGEMKVRGDILYASGRPDGVQRPIELIPLWGPPRDELYKKHPTFTVRWQPTKLSFDLQLTHPNMWPGTKANGSHVEVWFGREMMLPWVHSVIDQPMDGVRHLVIDFEGDKPQVSLVYPSGTSLEHPKPIQGSLTRNDAGWLFHFDLDYADLVGFPRRLRGSRQAVAAFQENEILLFALTVIEGSGPEKLLFAPSNEFQAAVPATFNRLFLGERGQLPELTPVMFGLTP